MFIMCLRLIIHEKNKKLFRIQYAVDNIGIFLETVTMREKYKKKFHGSSHLSSHIETNARKNIYNMKN